LQEIIGLLCNFLNECEKSVNALIKFEFNANIEAIEPLMAKIMQQINQDFDILIE
jgi:phage-related protein